MTRVALVILALLLAGCADGPTTEAPREPSAPTCAPENTNCNGAAQPSAPAPSAPTFTPPTCAPEDTRCNGAPHPGDTGAGCNAPNVTLTHDLTDTTKIDRIVPPGNLAGDGTVKAHSHVFPKAPAQVAVFAPVGSTLTKLTYYQESGEAIYLLEMQVDCRTSYRVDHLAKMPPRLAALDPPLRQDTRNDDPPLDLVFEAGELLGETSGGAASSFFDFGMSDASVVNANVQNATAMFQHVHAICPYDRFAPEIREKYLGLLAAIEGARSAVCRSPARDVAGTLQGSWFLGDASNDFGARAAIAPDLDGTVFFTLTAPSGERVDVRDKGGFDPATVGPGETVCYQGDTGPSTGTFGWARLSADARSVALAWGAGACPTAGPANAITYFR